MGLLPKILCLFALLACAPLAHAQIYHCIGAHGEPVFSGQPCGNPAPSSSNAGAAGNALGGACAASPQALRQAIGNAFATHDVNRLAGLILWRGLDQASARNTLRSLAEWLKQPLTGIAIARAAGPPFGGTDSPPDASTGAANAALPPPTGFEISTAEGGTRGFGVTEFGGCWWLTF
ncbi:MAG TPA: DUF4124 domain-containing protein [Rhodanobacteraceae bacterium]|nr:DUF4124 domain-containing protein [Rhodanobacteraceae bacterium]